MIHKIMTSSLCPLSVQGFNLGSVLAPG